MAGIIILFFVLLLYCGLIIFYQISWNKIRLNNKSLLDKKCKTTISVIVPARNESEHISTCIQSLVDQSYNSKMFEIIIVDDYSTDKTSLIAKAFLQKNVQVVTPADLKDKRPINSYKKKAIETGILLAAGELIVCTDADCIVPKYWLQSIAAFYENTGTEFISAPVKFYDPGKGGLLKKLLFIFQSIDFTSLQGISGAATASGLHYMCNGANLAFKKNSFYAVGGYKGIDDIASGDDMLLMEKFVETYPGKVKFLKSTHAIVETAPAPSIKAFFQQRIRWASKAGKYKSPVTKIVLSIVYLLNLLILATAIICFIDTNYLLYLFISVLLKTLVELWFLLPVTSFYRNRQILKWFIAAVPFHITYTVIAGAFGMFGKYEWKGRIVK